MKMNELLAKTEHKASCFSSIVKDYIKFFKGSAGAFTGETKTYQACEGYEDVPSKRGVRKVITTVNEKLDYFDGIMKDFLRNQFSVEATNAIGNKVPLIVDGVNFGELTSYDLMRLKNILCDNETLTMYNLIPVRSDADIWNPTTNEEYKDRNIFEKPRVESDEHTTINEEVILEDPNLRGREIPSNYVATKSVKRKTVTVGKSTRQEFSGEWTQVQRANLLKRRSEILDAVISALKRVNEVDTVKSNLNVDSFVEYLHYGRK